MASSRSEGVLKILSEPDGARHEPGSRMVLVPIGDDAPPVRFVVECLLPPRQGTNKLHIRWVLISAAGRRSYLVEILTELLGLNVNISSERDILPKDRVLLFDAETRRIRALQLKGTKKAQPSANDLDDTGETDARHHMLRQGEAVKRDPDALTKSTEQPLQWLMFERPRADGRLDVAGQKSDMECSWVGFSRCRFEIDGVDGPPMGTELSVGVPTDPLLRGLVWLEGRVCLNTSDVLQNRSVIEVEWLDEPGMLPSGYRSLVAFCRMSTLKRLGDREPQFIS